MDFRLDGIDADLYELADTTLGRTLPDDVIAGDASLTGGIALGAWQALVDAGVLEALLPERMGGAGLPSYVAHALVRVGAEHGSMVPTLPVLTALLALTRDPDDDRFDDLLADVTAGRSLITSAVREPGGRWVEDMRTTATPQGDGYVLSGTKTFVQLGRTATHVLVPALAPQGPIVAVVPGQAKGVTWVDQPVQSHVPAAAMMLDRVTVPEGSILGQGMARDTAARDLDWTMSISMCAASAGTLHRALELAVAHVGERQQFGRAIGSFQAVKMQLADAHIASAAHRSMADAAAWQFFRNQPQEIRRSVAAATYLMAHDLPPAVLTCQHVLGGTGMDTDHPMHRFVVTGLDLANVLGGVDACLDRALSWAGPTDLLRAAAG